MYKEGECFEIADTQIFFAYHPYAGIILTGSKGLRRVSNLSTQLPTINILFCQWLL